MICKEKGCGGEIDTTTEINLPTGCCIIRPAYACSKCGRIHWPCGNPVFNRLGDVVFLKKGKIVHKKSVDNLLN